MTTPKLMTASRFATRYFDPDCQPDLRTVRTWVQSGEVPGRIIGKQTYVDAQAFERSTGNALADQVLGG